MLPAEHNVNKVNCSIFNLLYRQGFLCLIYKPGRSLSGKTPNLVVLMKITYVKTTNTAPVLAINSDGLSLPLCSCDRIAHCDFYFQPQGRRSHISPADRGGANHHVGLPCPSSSSASMASSKKSCPEVKGATSESFKIQGQPLYLETAASFTATTLSQIFSSKISRRF